MNLLNPDFDVNKLASSYQNASPVPHICFDNFLSEDFAREVRSGFPSIDEAKQIGRSFAAVNERGKTQICDSTQFAPAVLRLHQLLASDAFVRSLETLTGIGNLIADPELVGGGIHETGARGHLDVHVDFNYIAERQLHRRLNILIYFNEHWEESWGGSFELWNQDVTECEASFLPIFNRMCMFSTSEISYHGVTAVRCPQGQARKSFAAYYYTREAPAGWDGTSHTTIFKARPDEKLKGSVLMPASHAVHRTKGLLKKMLGRGKP